MNKREIYVALRVAAKRLLAQTENIEGHQPVWLAFVEADDPLGCDAPVFPFTVFTRQGDDWLEAIAEFVAEELTKDRPAHP